MLGYVYCFSNDKMEGIYKIGLTTRTPLMRLREANMGDTWSLTSKFNIEFAKEVCDCHEKERQIHKHISLIGERVCEKREFFKISLDVIKSVFDLIDGRWYRGHLDENNNNDVSEMNTDGNQNCHKLVSPKIYKTNDNSDVIYCDVETSNNEQIVTRRDDVNITYKDANITKDDIITCGKCSKIYKNLKTYKQHFDFNRCEKISIPRKIDSKCQYCEKEFATKQNKQRHEKICGECKITSYKLTVEKIKRLVGNDTHLGK